jgi:hypothetical protein
MSLPRYYPSRTILCYNVMELVDPSLSLRHERVVGECDISCLPAGCGTNLDVRGRSRALWLPIILRLCQRDHTQYIYYCLYPKQILVCTFGPEGKYDPISQFNTFMYDVCFPDGDVKEFTANTISENLLNEPN